MPPQEAQAWWADVEHLREDLERRRARREGRSPQSLRLVEGGGQSTSQRRGPHEPLRVAPEPHEGRAHVREAAPASRRPGREQASPPPADSGRERRGEPGRFSPSAADLERAREQHEPGPSLTELLRAHLEAGLRAVREPLATRDERLATARSPREERLSEPPLHHPPAPDPVDPVQDARAQARRAAREVFADWSIVEPPVPGERRTVQIRGRQDHPPHQGGGRPASIVRRPAPSARDRIDHRPDRIAAWAVALGFLLILMAAGTADAASLPLP